MDTTGDRALEPTGLIRRPKNGRGRGRLGVSWGRMLEMTGSHSRNTDPRLRRNDGRSPVPRVHCLPPKFHIQRKAKHIACRRPWCLKTKDHHVSNRPNPGRQLDEARDTERDTKCRRKDVKRVTYPCIPRSYTSLSSSQARAVSRP